MEIHQTHPLSAYHRLIIALAAVLFGTAGCSGSERADAPRALDERRVPAEGDPGSEVSAGRALAERGDAGAQDSLGVMNATGEGVPRDATEARRWYRPAKLGWIGAGLRLAAGQSNLRVRYATADDGAQDVSEAVRRYRLAAEQGFATAQVALGAMYATGDGVPHNDVEAVRWYRLAADQGNAEAQCSLGFMYATGRGVPQVDVEAHMWFNLAAAQRFGETGDPYVELRDGFAEFLTAEQVAEAQRRAREWTPEP